MNDDSEPAYLGVDWASGCWVVVGFDDEDSTVTVTTEPSILNVWHEYGQAADAMLVDIPIGLPDDGPRACDQAARAMLGGRGSSVFAVPCRAAVDTADYETARDENKAAGCGGLGSQSWGLIPRIREVDVFLEGCETASEKIFESHPEVCYRAFSDDELPSKSSPEGIDDRIDVLEEVGDDGRGGEIRRFVEKRRDGAADWHDRIQSGRIDDVLDAAVLAMTAWCSHPSYAVLPETPESDDTPVIVYPEV